MPTIFANAIRLGRVRRNTAMPMSADEFDAPLRDYGHARKSWFREVAQNSFDNGARRLYFTTGESRLSNGDGCAWLAGADDGTGMPASILLDKFLVTGASGKHGLSTVGGFGQAKKLLIWPRRCWAVATRDGNGNLTTAIGVWNEWDVYLGNESQPRSVRFDRSNPRDIRSVVGAPLAEPSIEFPLDVSQTLAQVQAMLLGRGTALCVWDAGKEHPTQTDAAAYFAFCNMPSADIRFNGLRLDCNFTPPASEAREIEAMPAGVRATWYAPTAPTHGCNVRGTLVVRAAGQCMWADDTIPTGTLIVEITGDTKTLLATSRDKWKGWDAGYEVSKRLNEIASLLAVDVLSAFRPPETLDEEWGGEGDDALVEEVEIADNPELSMQRADDQFGKEEWQEPELERDLAAAFDRAGEGDAGQADDAQMAEFIDQTFGTVGGGTSGKASGGGSGKFGRAGGGGRGSGPLRPGPGGIFLPDENGDIVGGGVGGGGSLTLAGDGPASGTVTINVAVSVPTIEQVKDVLQLANPGAAKKAAKLLAWTAPLRVVNEWRDWKVSPEFRAEQMGVREIRLLRAWTAALRCTLALAGGYGHRFGVGFIFSEGVLAESNRPSKKYKSVCFYLLNPFLSSQELRPTDSSGLAIPQYRITLRPDDPDRSIPLDPFDDRHLSALTSRAIHEIVHGYYQVSGHNEEFAAALTSLFAQVGDRFKDIFRAAKRAAKSRVPRVRGQKREPPRKREPTEAPAVYAEYELDPFFARLGEGRVVGRNARFWLVDTDYGNPAAMVAAIPGAKMAKERWKVWVPAANPLNAKRGYTHAEMEKIKSGLANSDYLGLQVRGTSYFPAHGGDGWTIDLYDREVVGKSALRDFFPGAIQLNSDTFFVKMRSTEPDHGRQGGETRISRRVPGAGGQSQMALFANGRRNRYREPPLPEMRRRQFEALGAQARRENWAPEVRSTEMWQHPTFRAALDACCYVDGAGSWGRNERRFKEAFDAAQTGWDNAFADLALIAKPKSSDGAQQRLFANGKYATDDDFDYWQRRAGNMSNYALWWSMRDCYDAARRFDRYDAATAGRYADEGHTYSNELYRRGINPAQRQYPPTNTALVEAP